MCGTTREVTLCVLRYVWTTSEVIPFVLHCLGNDLQSRASRFPCLFVCLFINDLESYFKRLHCLRSDLELYSSHFAMLVERFRKVVLRLRGS